MTTKIRTILATLGIVVIGAVVMSSVAHTAGRGHGRGGGKMKMFEKLNLTEQQKSQIKALREQFQRDNAAALDRIKALHTQAREYAKAKDRENMKATREQVKTQMEALKPARQRLHEQIMAILTAEQRQQLEQMKTQHKEHGRKGKGKRDGSKGQGRPGEGTDLD